MKSSLADTKIKTYKTVYKREIDEIKQGSRYQLPAQTLPSID